MDVWRTCPRNQSNKQYTALTWIMPIEPPSGHRMCASLDRRQQTLNSDPRPSAHVSALIEVSHLSSHLFRPLMPGFSSVLWSNLPQETSLYLELTLCLEPTEYLLVTLFHNRSLCMFICCVILPSIIPHICTSVHVHIHHPLHTKRCCENGTHIPASELILYHRLCFWGKTDSSPHLSLSCFMNYEEHLYCTH